MKQEEKELLLKDLCGRLPYGVKVKTSFNKIDGPVELKSINIKDGIFSIGGEYTTISGISLDAYECKPYLFPLSSMTEEQKKEYNYECNEDLKVLSHSLTNRTYIKARITTPLYYGIDWLNANNFDYRGLIPMGLALDATGLNVY